MGSLTGARMEAAPPLPPIIAILGPTGSGKSSLAMNLVAEFGGEIISADSRQVYRLLDIGTEKPTKAQRAAVAHHCVDLIDPDRSYTVVDFQRDATSALAGIAARGKTAFVVGGTGQYARALLQGMTFPSAPEGAVRTEVEAEVRERGLAWAVAEIERIDPATLRRLDVSNCRRVTRALEIIRRSGLPIPAVQTNPLPALVIGLRQQRDRLYERLDNRVESQMEAGLAAETRRILALGYSPELPVLRGLAYGQMIRYLSGALTREQAVGAYKTATRRLARRQMTWFRKEPGLQWHDVNLPGFEDGVRGQIAEHLAVHRRAGSAGGA